MKAVELNETEVDAKMLAYLKKRKLQNPEHFDKVILWGVKPNSIIKYLENHESVKRWDNLLFEKLENAINKIAGNCSVPYPEIPEQTEEDKLLSKIITKSGWRLFNTDFWDMEINRTHIVKYLNRDIELKEWNADFVLKVQWKVAEVKDYLLNG